MCISGESMGLSLIQMPERVWLQWNSTEFEKSVGLPLIQMPERVWL